LLIASQRARWAVEQEKLAEEQRKDATVPWPTRPAASEEAKAEAAARKAEGNRLFGAGKFRDAVRLYSEAIELDGSDHTFYGNRAACLLHLDEFAHALKDAVTAKKLKPDWVKAHYRVGQAYMGLRHYENAAQAFWEGVRLDMDNKEVKAMFEKAVEKARQATKAAQLDQERQSKKEKRKGKR